MRATIDRRRFLEASTLTLLAARSVSAEPAPPLASCDDPKLAAEVEQLRTDWPRLTRYREPNHALLAGGAGAEVVFIGDSITEGWTQKTPDFFTHGRIGRGIGGQTTPQLLVRFRPDVIHLKPRVVHIMAGTNDIAGNTGPSTPEMTQDNLMSMTEIAQANGIRVILASIPPARHFPWLPRIETVAPIRAQNDWLKRYASSGNAIYADYYTALADSAGAMKVGLAYDGVHPTAEGYAVMNPIADKAIRQALAIRVHR